MSDSNANNADKALDVVVAFLEKADEAQAARCVLRRLGLRVLPHPGARRLPTDWAARLPAPRVSAAHLAPPPCRIAGPVCGAIAAKSLKGRPATLAKAADACLLFVELEQSGAVVEAMQKAFSDKVPKVVVAALDILVKAVR